MCGGIRTRIDRFVRAALYPLSYTGYLGRERRPLAGDYPSFSVGSQSYVGGIPAMLRPRNYVSRKNFIVYSICYDDIVTDKC